MRRRVVSIEVGRHTRSNGLGAKFGTWHYFHLSCGHMVEHENSRKRWIKGVLTSPKTMDCPECRVTGQHPTIDAALSDHAQKEGE